MHVGEAGTLLLEVHLPPGDEEHNEGGTNPQAACYGGAAQFLRNPATPTSWVHRRRQADLPGQCHSSSTSVSAMRERVECA